LQTNSYFRVTLKISSTIIVVCMSRTVKENKSLNITVSIINQNIVILIILFTTFYFLKRSKLSLSCKQSFFFLFSNHLLNLPEILVSFFVCPVWRVFLIPKKFNLRIYNVMCQNRSHVINSLSLSSFTAKQKTVWW